MGGSEGNLSKLNPPTGEREIIMRAVLGHRDQSKDANIVFESAIREKQE